jgi:hypothetical protein
MFEREWREEARQLEGDYKHPHRRRFDFAEVAHHRYPESVRSEAEKIVRTRWIERGLWQKTWDQPGLKEDGANGEEVDEIVVGKSWYPILHHPAIAYDEGGYRSTKRACRWNFEAEFERSRNHPRTYPTASRPRQMFRYEVSLRIQTLCSDVIKTWREKHIQNARIRMPDPEEEVRAAWKEDGLWLDEWR